MNNPELFIYVAQNKLKDIILDKESVIDLRLVLDTFDDSSPLFIYLFC